MGYRITICWLDCSFVDDVPQKYDVLCSNASIHGFNLNLFYLFLNNYVCCSLYPYNLPFLDFLEISPFYLASFPVILLIWDEFRFWTEVECTTNKQPKIYVEDIKRQNKQTKIRFIPKSKMNMCNWPYNFIILQDQSSQHILYAGSIEYIYFLIASLIDFFIQNLLVK